MNNIDELIENISNKYIHEGRNKIIIIFHYGLWKDIFITYSSENNITEIGKTGLIEIIKNCRSFPEYGQIEYEFILNNNTISECKTILTSRIHNNKKSNIGKENQGNGRN